MNPDALWESTPELGTLFRFAKSRLVSPWALLGAVLTRVLSEVGPAVTLPPLRGSSASLNLGICLVGPSGAGKSASVSVATEFLGLVETPSPFQHDIKAKTITAGSGEGLTQAFIKPKTNSELIDEPKAFLHVDEVTQIGELQSRLGNTFGSVLRLMLTGNAVGQTNADGKLNRMLKANTYRLAGVIGVQPRHSGVLLNDVDAGTPQRFVWLPALDNEKDPDMFGQSFSGMQWAPPDQTGDMKVCAKVKQAVWNAAVNDHENPLDGHRVLTREKVAAALGFLHSDDISPDVEITEQWWDLSDLVMQKSDEVRNECSSALLEAEADEARRKGRQNGLQRIESQATELDWLSALAPKWVEIVNDHYANGKHWEPRGGHDAGHPCGRSCLTRFLKLQQASRQQEFAAFIESEGLLQVIEVQPSPNKPVKLGFLPFTETEN